MAGRIMGTARMYKMAKNGQRLTLTTITRITSTIVIGRARIMTFSADETLLLLLLRTRREISFVERATTAEPVACA